MTFTADGLYGAGLALEEDIRKMDAGELDATPEQRAFLMGAKNALLKARVAQTGGYPVDDPAATPPPTPGKPEVQGAEVFDPQNFGLAGDVDGGGPFTKFKDKSTIDGGNA